MTAEPFNHPTDLIVILRWIFIIVAVFALIFRGHIWLRLICVIFALVSIAFACMRIEVSPRMAVDQLSYENKPWSEAFRDGSLYTRTFSRTSIPTFLLTGVVLAALAVIPAKKPKRGIR